MYDNIAIFCSLVGFVIILISGIIAITGGLEEYCIETFTGLIYHFVGTILLVALCWAYPLTNPMYNIQNSEQAPTFISKVNNNTVVLVVDQQGKIAYAKTFVNDAVYWNSTNIVLNVTKGKVLFGHKITYYKAQP